MRATLSAIKAQLRIRRHWDIGVNGRWLARVVRGWFNYHAVPGNMKRLQQFRDEVVKQWLHQLRRRSQRSRWTWKRMQRLARRHLPQPKITHDYPSKRFRARLEAGAVCGNSSRTDLCGGRLATAIPTAIVFGYRPFEYPTVPCCRTAICCGRFLAICDRLASCHRRESIGGRPVHRALRSLGTRSLLRRLESPISSDWA